MRPLPSDAFVVATVAMVVTLVLVSLVLPAALVDEIGWWADMPLLGVTILATWRAATREPTSWGRGFWTLTSLAFCLWLGVVVEWHLPAISPWFDSDLFGDYLFLGYYLVLLLATAARPHARRERLRLSAILVTEMAAGVTLAFGLLAYFVILPSRLAPVAYATFVPSLSLYVLLDVVLLLRLGWWCRSARGTRWYTVYCALIGGFGFTLLHDIHELLVYTVGDDLATSPWDVVWWAQFPCLVLAARLGVRGAVAGASDEVDAVAARPAAHALGIFGPVVSYAFVLPVVHLAGRVLGLLDPVLDGSRETLVLACALLLGGQAVLHQYLLNDRFRRLSGDLYEARILLQQSRKMEALGRLAGGVAHGFNNLLSVILGYTEMLAERFTPGDQASESLQQVKLAAEKASALTRQLAIFSLGRLGRDVPLELDAVVAGHLPIVRRLLTGSVTLTFRPGAPGAWIRADADQFERALLNIAANARDAIEGAGEVRITTRTLALAEGDASIGLLPPGPYVEIAISDTGAGMSDPVRSRLFEPFFTTRQDEGHRGLGLAIVYGVVRQASGHIEVHSAPGAGTTIRMYLPRCLPAQTAAEEAEDRGAHVGGRPFTVLLAEDEAGLRRLIRSTLEAEGFRVIEAADGQAAVDCAEQHPGAIDLFLSDVVMPGCAGPEAARRIVEERPETRVLFISGYAPEVLGDLRVRGAAVALVAKPFVLTDLLSQVRALLAGEIRSGSGPDERGSNESEVRT